MENIRIIEVVEQDGSVVEHVIIDKGNDQFTSMTKEHYDKLEAERLEQSLKIIT